MSSRMLNPQLFAYHAQQVRHAYRALLRATSYLPDSFTRTYMHNYIRFRFKENAQPLYAQLLAVPPIQRSQLYPLPRVKFALKSARALEQASNGHVKTLKKLLMLAHGRRGKRRRQLLMDLLRTDETALPKDDSALENMISQLSKNEGSETGRPPVFKPPQKFAQFIRSQQAHQPSESPRPSILKVVPILPEENSWGRPLPLKLAETLRLQWFKDTLTRIYPPMPVHEFNQLRDLALGTAPLEQVPPRRKRPPPEPLTEEEKTAAVLQYIKFPRKIKDPNLDDLRFDPEHEIISREKSDPEIHTKICGRTLRRLYGSVWEMSSTMTQDPATGRWTIQWGRGKGACQRGDFATSSPLDTELFEGLDKLPAPKKRKKKPGREEKKIQKLLAAARAQEAKDAAKTVPI